MENDIYRKLQQQIDQYSIGFPAADSGVDQEILKRLFTEDEARLYLDMSMQLENAESVAGRTARELAEIAEALETMAQKGLLFRKRKSDGPYYAAIPFIVGIMEFQLNTMDRELSLLLEKYFAEVYSANMGKTIQPLRTIPVNRSVDITQKVASYEDAREIIKSKDKIAVANCICRTQKSLIESDCGKPLEVCFSFGSHADYYMENGMARSVGIDEALAILDECQKAGLVNQPANMINPGGMCNCCGDCCGILRALNQTPQPARMVNNNYRAAVEDDLCTGCEICLDRCQMGAIAMNDDAVSVIDADRCIGCGLCVTTCPAEALSMVLKPEAERITPFASGMELMLKTVEQRGTSLIPLSMAQK